MTKRQFRKLRLDNKAIYLVGKHCDGKKYKSYELIAFMYCEWMYGTWIAIDNRNGDCRIDTFKTKDEAFHFIHGDDDLMEYMV